MDNDLDRSLRLLEDAISTPTKGLFKVPVTPSSRKKEPGPGSQFDLSISLSASEYNKLLVNDGRSIMYNDTMVALLDQDRTLTGSIIHTGQPWRNTMDNLYLEFADIMQETGEGGDMLDTAADLARCCSDALAVVHGLKSKVATVSLLAEEKWLENERNNWRLLFVLYQDRLNSGAATGDNGDREEPELEPQRRLGRSEKLCIARLFKRDGLVRESQLVVDWLERCALERDDPILHHADWTYGWEHSLHQLLAPEAIAIASNTPMVRSLHPDAPARENLPLHHLDATNDQQLCKRVFTEIRCGRLEEAQQICLNSGHPWRAAIFEGWKPYHNPNLPKIPRGGTDKDVEMQDIDGDEDGEMVTEVACAEVEGNMRRDLWKLMAIKFCKKKNLNLYEKASVAVLCGYLESALTVCSSWEDHLWAYMKSMVDIRVESEIRDNVIRDYEALPEEYWRQKMSLNEIFERLESSGNPEVRAQSQERDHIIQKHVVLDEVPKLVELLEQWAEDPETSTQSLRFYTHLILFLETVGESIGKHSSEKILLAYINKLSEMNQTQLVAYYVSKLGRRQQVPVYAAHLENIIDHEDRRAALNYAEGYSLDVFAITTRVVESIRSRPTQLEATGNLNRKLTDLDEFTISALDWLIFYEEQRLEALRQSNAIIFKFLAMRKIDAAQLTLGKIPANSIDEITKEGEVSEDINQVIKEHLSYRAYLDANEIFNRWFQMANKRPTPPAPLPADAQFTERVAHDHRVSQFGAETESWRLKTTRIAKTAKAALYNVLTFPGGWLGQDGIGGGGEDADYLRSICVPEVVLLLYSILSETDCHEEAVRLADLIASDRYQIYKNYSKEKLGEILEKLCESSVALLNAKKDPFGNPTTA